MDVTGEHCDDAMARGVCDGKAKTSHKAVVMAPLTLGMPFIPPSSPKPSLPPLGPSLYHLHWHFV